MGLESVEFFMQLEETFGIDLPENEVRHAYTPAAVIDLVVSKVQQSEDPACSTQRAFHVLRQALMKTLNLSRDKITLTTPIAGLFPENADEMRSLWSKLKKETCSRSWPDLSLPKWMSIGMTCLWVLMVILFLSFLVLPERMWHIHPLWFLIINPISATLLIYLLLLRLEPFRKHLPYGIKTVRDMIRPVLSSDKIEWNRKMISVEVRRILIEDFRIPEEYYHEHAHIIKDQGMG